VARAAERVDAVGWRLEVKDIGEADALFGKEFVATAVLPRPKGGGEVAPVSYNTCLRQEFY